MNTIGHSFQNSYRNSNNFCTVRKGSSQSKGAVHASKGVSEIKRMLSNTGQQNQGMSSQAVSINMTLENTQSYGKMLRTQRQQAKDTALKLKKLKYHFKDISSKILRSKTSTTARQVASQARREVLRLKREKQNGSYDNEEIDAAITHAKAMERVAKKKVKHLEEEEMAKASGGLCAGSLVEEEETEKICEDKYESVDNSADITDNYRNEQKYSQILDEISAIFSDMDELTTEMFEEISGEMKEMFEDMEFDELSDELLSVKGDMDPADLKAMKMKHRNKEMKDIVKADAEYLKAVFDHLEKIKDSGASFGSSCGGDATVPAAVSAAVPVTNSMPAPVINIEL